MSCLEILLLSDPLLVNSWKVYKYRGFFDPCFAVFGPEKTPYLDNFYVAGILKKWEDFLFYRPRNG